MAFLVPQLKRFVPHSALMACLAGISISFIAVTALHPYTLHCTAPISISFIAVTIRVRSGSGSELGLGLELDVPLNPKT